jgi:hypothetical protein
MEFLLTKKAAFCFASIILLFAPARGLSRGLSDLEEFARSPQQIEKVLSDPGLKQKYRKALENYGSKSAPLTQNFDQTWEQLRRLHAEVDGFKARLATTKKPLAFQYKHSSKETYRFERVHEPLHTIWFLQNLHESEKDVCTQRDILLADRWTPMLKDASLFAVEKNGKYTGNTLTLVPVKSGSATYLLVVPSDTGSPLPQNLLESFLRDYRKSEPSSLRFALLSKIPNQRNAYQVERVDDGGRKVGRLGPVEGFHLADTMAKKISAFAPAHCVPASSGVASLPANSLSGGANTSTGPAIVVNANPAVTINSAGKDNSEGAVAQGTPKGLQNSGGIQNLRGDSQTAPLGLPPPRQAANPGTTIINNQNGNRVRARGETGGGVIGAFVPESQGQMPGVAPANPNLPTLSANLNSDRRKPDHQMGQQQGMGQGQGIIGNKISPHSTGVQSVVLSPGDQKFRRSLDEGLRALNEGRPIPRPILRDIFRGADKAENPDLQKELLNSGTKMYYQNREPLDAYRSLWESYEDDSKLVESLNRSLCQQCPDCAFCREIKHRAGIKEGSITQ